jgi:hypothetical protein
MNKDVANTLDAITHTVRMHTVQFKNMCASLVGSIVVVVDTMVYCSLVAYQLSSECSAQLVLDQIV